MKINTNSHVILDEGDIFVSERQDEDNIWRTATYKLQTGAIVTVQRHFSQIGPVITDHKGRRVETKLDRETHTVVPL